MLDPLQFYCRVLCNGMKTRFRMVMIAHPGPGIGFHKRFMWWIIIPPTASGPGPWEVSPASSGTLRIVTVGGGVSQIDACCRREIEITREEIYSTHTTKKAGYVVERDWPRYI